MCETRYIGLYGVLVYISGYMRIRDVYVILVLTGLSSSTCVLKYPLLGASGYSSSVLL